MVCMHLCVCVCVCVCVCICVYVCGGGGGGDPHPQSLKTYLCWMWCCKVQWHVALLVCSTLQKLHKLLYCILQRTLCVIVSYFAAEVSQAAASSFLECVEILEKSVQHEHSTLSTSLCSSTLQLWASTSVSTLPKSRISGTEISTRTLPMEYPAIGELTQWPRQWLRLGISKETQWHGSISLETQWLSELWLIQDGRKCFENSVTYWTFPKKHTLNDEWVTHWHGSLS